jgi:hypothetical protein
LPPELRQVQDLMTAGVVMGYQDYLTMPAVLWRDIVLWKEAEAERARAEMERSKP